MTQSFQACLNDDLLMASQKWNCEFKDKHIKKKLLQNANTEFYTFLKTWVSLMVEVGNDISMLFSFILKIVIEVKNIT